MSAYDALRVIKGICEAELAGEPVTPTPTTPTTPTPTTPTTPTTPATPAGTLTKNDYWLFAGTWGDTRTMIEARKAPLPPGWSWEDAYASGAITREAGYQSPTTDRRSLRDLSEVNGPAVVEGNAGTVVFITCRRPIGERLEITASKTQSAFGDCQDVEIWCNGAHARSGAQDSNAMAKVITTSTGNDLIRVLLHQAGAIAVQRN